MRIILIIYIGGYGGWDDSGCSLVNGTNDTSFCECDHLTNFALLLVCTVYRPPYVHLSPSTYVHIYIHA